MKLEDQCVSLELARRLKELGIKQKSLFYHAINYEHKNEGSTIIYKDSELFLLSYDKEQAISYEQVMGSDWFYCRELYSAFTVAELGEMLPDCLYAQSATGKDRPLFMNKVDGIYSVGILNPNNTIFPRYISENEANARAEMLIHLIENKLMELE